MKIWTCGSSLWSGSQNAWTRIKNVNGANSLSNFWNFFSAIQMISCRDWWPWTKPGCITMTRRQSNNQWSGSIAAHPAPKNSKCKNPLKRFLPRFFGSRWHPPHFDYLPKGQTVNAEYYLSLLLQLKDILKEKHAPWEGHQGGLVLAWQCPGSPGSCNPEETGLAGLPMSWSPNLFSGSGPVGLPPVTWTEKTIERSAIFVRRGGHCCRGDLVGRRTFWFFFSVACKS